jgi:hypothetical protein
VHAPGDPSGAEQLTFHAVPENAQLPFGGKLIDAGHSLMEIEHLIGVVVLPEDVLSPPIDMLGGMTQEKLLSALINTVEQADPLPIPRGLVT